MKLVGNGPFAVTAFTNSAWIETQFSEDNTCTISTPADQTYLNVSQIVDDGGRIRFLCSAVLQIVRGATTPDPLDLAGKMSGPNCHSGSLTLTGASRAVLVPAPSRHADTSLASRAFPFDGWHGVVPVASGVPGLNSRGWLPSGAPLKRMFEVACQRASLLHTASVELNAKRPTHLPPEDLLAVALQAGAGPYTHQLGGDWRGCGYSAKCTNQDCDGMAMNVLVFFSALIREAKGWAFAADSIAETARIELIRYDTPVFLTGQSARPSSLVPCTNNTDRPKYCRPTDEWPIGHAWAGIMSSTTGKYIHVECTTPGATTPDAGLDERKYRAQIELAGGLEEIDGSHGHVSAVGVRQHHKDCYGPLAAYTPTAMYTPGVHDVCASGLTGLDEYYSTAFRKVDCTTVQTGPQYAYGAHRPECSAVSSYPSATPSPYLETPSLLGEHGLHAFARFSVGKLKVADHPI